MGTHYHYATARKKSGGLFSLSAIRTLSLKPKPYTFLDVTSERRGTSLPYTPNARESIHHFRQLLICAFGGRSERFGIFTTGAFPAIFFGNRLMTAGRAKAR